MSAHEGEPNSRDELLGDPISATDGTVVLPIGLTDCQSILTPTFAVRCIEPNRWLPRGHLFRESMEQSAPSTIGLIEALNAT